MREWVDLMMLVTVLLNIALLSSGRIFTCIRVVAAHGIIAGLLPAAMHGGALEPRTVLFAAVTVAIKGVVFPMLLFRSLREANISREVEPLVSYPVSMVAGVLALLASFWFVSVLPLPREQLTSPFVGPVPCSTILVGLFIIATRTKALTQVLGYLVLENGIYAFSAVLLRHEPVMVELGVLLDVFVAVFVMGIAIFHINREFDHIDTDVLSELEDWRPGEREVAE